MSKISGNLLLVMMDTDTENASNEERDALNLTQYNPSFKLVKLKLGWLLPSLFCEENFGPINTRGISEKDDNRRSGREFIAKA